MATPSTLRNQWSVTSTTAISNTTAVTIAAASQQTNLVGNVTNNKNFLTDLYFINTSSTPTVVQIIDAGSSAVLMNLYAPASSTVPTVINLTTPVAGTPNSALQIKAVTTGANIYWAASGFIATANA